MGPLKLLIQEIRYRKLNFLLCLLGVTAAVGLLVAGSVLMAGYAQQSQAEIVALEAGTDAELAKMEDETRKLMIKMGFNLMIVHRDTNMEDFWSSDFSTVDMPQEYVDRLAESPDLTLVTHLVATLQQRYDWNGRKVLLVGYLPETPKKHEGAKKPMGLNIAPSTAILGHELGQGRQVGEKIQIDGRDFEIAKILPEKGSKEDITLALHLSDAQTLLNRPGKVNQIMALGCQCQGERLAKIRAQLQQVLPETKITEFESIAVARAEQRDMVAVEREKIISELSAHRERRLSLMSRLASILSPLVLALSGTWVGVLTLANVRERRGEIGLLRALGKRTSMIAGLFMGKALLLGLLGAACGLALGALAARLLLTEGMQVPREYFELSRTVIWGALIGAPLLCLAASYLPMLSAILSNPAHVLRDE